MHRTVFCYLHIASPKKKKKSEEEEEEMMKKTELKKIGKEIRTRQKICLNRRRRMKRRVWVIYQKDKNSLTSNQPRFKHHLYWTDCFLNIFCSMYSLVYFSFLFFFLLFLSFFFPTM